MNKFKAFFWNFEFKKIKEDKMKVQEEMFSYYDISEDIKSLLSLAANSWENTSESEKYINEAVDKAEGNTDVLIAAYRYFFYKNNCKMALTIADKVVDKIQNLEKLPDDWEELKPILVRRKNDEPIRLYLSAYAASGLVLARLGEIEKAKEVTQRVREINDTSEFAASVVHDVLTRSPEEDD